MKCYGREALYSSWLESIRCAMNALRNKCRMRWGISCRELNGLNAARLAGMKTPDCSWGFSASFQVDSYSKLTIAIVGFCSAVWIVMPQCGLSKHTLLIFSSTKTPVSFSSRFINECMPVFSCMAGRRECCVRALQLLSLLSEGSC